VHDGRESGGRRYVRRQRRLHEIRESIEANAYRAEDLENLGAEALEKGDYDVAELCLREACLSRKDPTAMGRFAQLMERAQEPDRALRGYEFAMAHGLRKPNIALRLGSLYEKRRRFDEAHRLALRYIEELTAEEARRPFVEMRRRVETKMGLRRQVDSVRETRDRVSRSQSRPGPGRTLERWLESLTSGDEDGFLACYLPEAQGAASRAFAGLSASLRGMQSVEVGGASEEGDRIRLRGRLRHSNGAPTPVQALLGRRGNDWLLATVELDSENSETADLER
jgi:hypothetical protein